MKKIDSIAFLIDGCAPIFIATFLFLITGAKDLIFYVYFAGSIATGQLLSTVVRVAYSNKNTKLLYRVDNFLRIVTICVVVVVKFYASEYYVIPWLIINVLVFWGIGKLIILGRLAFTITSYYSRLLNFIFLIAFMYSSNNKFPLYYFNGFAS
jgi:hypothetical protein